jgi:hypothetical protein
MGDKEAVVDNSVGTMKKKLLLKKKPVIGMKIPEEIMSRTEEKRKL